MTRAEVLLNCAVGDVVGPLLLSLVQETGQEIEAAVLLHYQGKTVRQDWPGSGDEVATEKMVRGQVRVLVKDAESRERFRFMAEAILEGLAPGSGFSGFSIQGVIDLGGAMPSAVLKTHTNQYNVWTWGKAFRHLSLS